MLAYIPYMDSMGYMLILAGYWLDDVCSFNDYCLWSLQRTFHRDLSPHRSKMLQGSKEAKQCLTDHKDICIWAAIDSGNWPCQMMHLPVSHCFWVPCVVPEAGGSSYLLHPCSPPVFSGEQPSTWQCRGPSCCIKLIPSPLYEIPTLRPQKMTRETAVPKKGGYVIVEGSRWK
jgi:hypothetical protein